ncbi:MAG: hypothetical protein ABIC04_03760 [Nanoarchaeota archaeon]
MSKKHHDEATTLITFVMILSAIIAAAITQSDFFWNTADQIYSVSHILFELLVIAVGTFLIADGFIGIGTGGFLKNWARYVRIYIGISIIFAHVTVIILGGYNL